jgi:AhpD family alkylhydroperoxidase
MSQETLTKKQEELVAVGASIAAGCRPCTVYHVAAARDAGAGDGEIRVSVDNALAVRDSARNGMAAFGASLLGETDEGVCISGRPPHHFVEELECLAAACAVNSVADVETHLALARGSGANEAQITIALSIARMVRKAATEKVEAALTSSPDDGSGASVCSPAGADGEAGDACSRGG